MYCLKASFSNRLRVCFYALASHNAPITQRHITMGRDLAVSAHTCGSLSRGARSFLSICMVFDSANSPQEKCSCKCDSHYAPCMWNDSLNEVSTVILLKVDKLVRVSGMSLHEAQRIVANFPVSRLTVRCLFRYTKKRSCSLRLEHNFSLRSLVHTLLMSIWWRAKKVRNASITEATSCSKHL